MRRKSRALLMSATLLLLISCRQRVSNEEARELVKRYNSVVSEAYRRCDVRLIDSVVGPNTVAGKRLTGLIGVRFDMGLALDAEQISLTIVDVRQEEDGMEVHTKERWRYRDRRIGSGQQIGEESVDSYEMLYEFSRRDERWLVAETRFAAPPQVGRQTSPWSADAKVLHQPMMPLRQEKEMTQ